MALQAHPDRGGKDAEMARLNDARRRAREDIRKRGGTTR
jgi:hypothetical protein